MACAVYCLVPRQEQLEPLVERLREAGVKTEDIAVVLRRGTETCAAHWSEASRLVQAVWDWSASSTALWLAFYGRSLGYSAAAEHAVVPLQQYGTGGAGKKITAVHKQ